jgi:hypothetical protein
MSTRKLTITLHCLLFLLITVSAWADNSSTEADDAAAAELAKKLANPVASLISVPLQYNYDENYGPQEKGSISKFNIQPVIPVTLSDQLNLITRTIVPLIDQDDIPVEGKGKSGLGDITASQFFSPKQPTAGGWIWGAGPVELLPTASDEMLGGEKWGLGPTAVVLKQVGPWTFGGLANHIWSIAGDDDRSDISATFVQPFLAYITKTKTTLGINTESSYDWETRQWSVPLNATVSQLLKIGPQIIQITVGARYWAESADNGPENWGARAQLTFLFPK